MKEFTDLSTGKVTETYNNAEGKSHEIVGFRQPVPGDSFLDPDGFRVRRKMTTHEYGPRLIVKRVKSSREEDDVDV